MTAVTTPGNGTAVITAGSTTTVTYTPDSGFSGQDSFYYTLSDGSDTDTGIVNVTVGAPAKPTGLAASASDTQATLTWNDASDSSITGYEFFLQAQVAKLTASDGSAGEGFGVAVAVDGDIAVVGADDNDGKGAVYVLSKQSGAWSEVGKLTASDGVSGDDFGVSVALDGDTVVVGASGDDGEGSAYVFTKPNTGWATANETAKLATFGGSAGDDFGTSVAVQGETVVVGATGDDDNGGGSGSAYVFAKPANGVWATATETAKLTAFDGAAGDRFGNSVAVDGDTLVVGSWSDDAYAGSAYLFIRPAGGWATANETARLTASDGAAGDWFGTSVAVDGDKVAVGASGNDDSGSQSGSAYVFIKPAGGWVSAT